MRITCLTCCLLFLLSCSNQKITTEDKAMSMVGTWKLISGTLIEKGDTVVTDYTKGLSFIKIINDSHFSFLLHDLSQGKDSAAIFSAGGGRYTLRDSAYTESLEYCSDRKWEGQEFHFTISIQHDTLIQRGIEKIDSIGVNRLNIEKYVRVVKQSSN